MGPKMVAFAPVGVFSRYFTCLPKLKRTRSPLTHPTPGGFAARPLPASGSGADRVKEYLKNLDM